MFTRSLPVAALICLAGFGPVSAQVSRSSEASGPPPFSAGSSGGYVRGPASDRVIVFVNGIFGDAVSTWTNDDGAYWPRMLVRDSAFDGTDIYVHSFQSPKITTAQQIGDLATRLRDFLQVDGVLNHSRIVFLVHSMGGLVTRAMIVNYRPPAAKIPMIFFFCYSKRRGKCCRDR
jgi:pimeloyl-ACP methyl ester carboxylesterase